eukprot:6208282-Pleurochrysis_carterae.AAC.1
MFAAFCAASHTEAFYATTCLCRTHVRAAVCHPVTPVCTSELTCSCLVLECARLRPSLRAFTPLCLFVHRSARKCARARVRACARAAARAAARV